MASFYPYSAFYVDGRAIPDRIDAKNVANFLCQNGTPLHLEPFLYGGSRGGWLNLVFIKIADKYDVAPLHFMCRKPWDEDFSMLLQYQQLPGVVAAIRFLLTRFESYPEEFIPMDHNSPWDREDILEELRGAQPSLSPQQDDGDAPNHFFAFLKSLLAFCDTAIENKQGVLFSQECEG